MRIQNNMMALNTYRQYNIANNQTAGYAEKLSSGYQINRAGDDAAGLAISEKMRAQIRGLNMASKNSLDAVSLIQTAEGALQSTHDILQRMRELAVQSASDTNEQVIDRGALDQEFQDLKKEIDDTARTTRFNDQNLIDGTFQKAFYSTDITYSKLTSQTVADVNRVGVKSNHNMDGIYNIGVQYIKGQDAVYAQASRVETQVTGDNRILLSSDIGTAAGGTSIINRVEFDAVVGAEHNGKTFTISASGEGNDLFDNNDGLKITMTDGDTVYTGVVVSTSRMDGGAEVTINFDGVGTMTLLLDEDIDVSQKDVYNIASSLNTKQIKFVQSPEIKEGTTPVGLGTTAVGLVAGGTATSPAGTGVTATIATGSMSIAGQLNIDVGGTAATAAVTVKSDASAYTGAQVTTGGALVLTVTYAGQSKDITVTTAVLDDAVALNTKIVAALQGYTDTIASATADYYIDTQFDFTSADKSAARTTVELTNATVDPITGPPEDLDFTNLAFTVTAEDGTTTTYDDATGNLNITGVAANLAEEMNIRIELDGYGAFDIHIGAFDGRDATALAAELTTALSNLKLELWDMTEGVDSVKKVDAQIALTLNGEVVMLSENDTKAAFDSSGVSLSFRPLDFANVTNTATATEQFTTSGSADTISIKVIENAGKALTIQTGANQGDELDINIDAMNLQMLGLTDSSIATQKSASRAITEVNNAINQVSTQRAALGALQNRLNFKIANLDTSAENLQAAESRIRDTDMAKVMTAFTKSNILGQAATAMLAQANSQPQNVLQLLR